MIVLQPPLLCEGWGGHPLCLSGDSPELMDLYWLCDCTAQYIIMNSEDRYSQLQKTRLEALIPQVTFTVANLQVLQVQNMR